MGGDTRRHGYVMEEMPRAKARIRKGDRSRGQEMSSGPRLEERRGAEEGEEGAKTIN